MKSWDDRLLEFLASPYNVIGAGVAALALVLAFLYFDQVFFYSRFISKSLMRNVVRTTLTFMATFVLVFVVTSVWTILYVLDLITTEKTKDQKAIVTERWQMPSMMPWDYEAKLAWGGAIKPEDVKVQDSMSWSFYGGTLDAEKRTRENMVFFFGMKPMKLINAVGLTAEEQSLYLSLKDERRRIVQSGGGSRVSQWDVTPAKGVLLANLETKKTQTEKELAKVIEPVIGRALQSQPIDSTDLARVTDFLTQKCSYTSMMDGIDELSAKEQRDLYLACVVMEKDRRKVLIGRERLQMLKRQVGDRFTVKSLNYPGIDLEVEVLGTFPDGRYNQNALLNRDYIKDGLDAWKVKNGKDHPMAGKSLSLMWLRVPDSETFREVAEDISAAPTFKDPPVKCETASSGVASFLDAYRDMLWGMRWLLIPAILVTMSLVIANAISISVRERRTEMAVLKVLGFGPSQIMVLILGEAILIGTLAGFISAFSTWYLVNQVIGGIKFPIGFFPAFRIPLQALLWGPMVGGLTAFCGSILPSWSARSVKVSEVFSKIS